MSAAGRWLHQELVANNKMQFITPALTNRNLTICPQSVHMCCIRFMEEIEQFLQMALILVHKMCSLWGREWILNNIWTHLCFKGSNKIYYNFHVESSEIKVSSLSFEFMCLLSFCFGRKAGGIHTADRNRSMFMRVVDLMTFMEKIASMYVITVLTFCMSSVLT
jgi:hypothetical protein